MSLFFGIFLAIIVFFVVVFLHELGHFLVARWSRVSVREFGIGMPPRLGRIFRDKKGTEWTLNWLPLGGFVRLKGEDALSPESLAPDSFFRASPFRQLCILIAGVVMNFLLAGILFGVLFFQGTPPITVHIRELAPHSLLSRIGEGTRLIPIYDRLADAESAGIIQRQPGVAVSQVVIDSVAQSAGLMAGDVILMIDGAPLDDPATFSRLLSATAESHTLHIDRDGHLLDISVVPVEGKIGIYAAPIMTLRTYQYPLPQALLFGVREAYDQTLFSFRSLGAMVSTGFSPTATSTEKQEVIGSVGGPIALGRVFVSLVDHGIDFQSILTLTALLSLSLCVFNLLPFPALDGGRILIILINIVMHWIAPRYQISPKIEQIIHSIGFLILIGLSILVAWKDIFTR